MKVDLHVHTCHSVDGLMSPEEVVESALVRNLGALAIIDHNSIDGALAVGALAPIPVIVGEEISTSDGELMALFLERAVPEALPALDTVNLVHEQGGLVGVPHPFDRFRPERLTERVLRDLSGRLDFVEGFNSRVTLNGDNRRASEFGVERGLLLTAGSDAHSRVELGRAYVEMANFSGSEDFVEALVQGTIEGSLSPFWVHFFSVYARTRRSLRGD